MINPWKHWKTIYSLSLIDKICYNWSFPRFFSLCSSLIFCFIFLFLSPFFWANPLYPLSCFSVFICIIDFGIIRKLHLRKPWQKLEFSVEIIWRFGGFNFVQSFVLLFCATWERSLNPSLHNLNPSLSF